MLAGLLQVTEGTKDVAQKTGRALGAAASTVGQQVSEWACFYTLCASKGSFDGTLHLMGQPAFTHA
jgi:hypothetical protein